jgi:hypothetical protein
VYRQTVIGGVKPRERWDYYDCRTCGPFQYRHRTKLLKSASGELPQRGGPERSRDP